MSSKKKTRVNSTQQQQQQQQQPESAIENFFSTNFGKNGNVVPLPSITGASSKKSVPVQRSPDTVDLKDESYSLQAVDGTSLEELAENIRALVLYEEHEKERAEALRKRLGGALVPAAGLSKTPQPSRHQPEGERDAARAASTTRDLVVAKDEHGDGDAGAARRKASSVEGRVLLHHKRVRQVSTGPIIAQERPLVDVWPARGPTGTATSLSSPSPVLFSDLEDELRLQLQRLSLKYPAAAKEGHFHSSCPSEEELLLQDEWRESLAVNTTEKQLDRAARQSSSRPSVVFGRSYHSPSSRHSSLTPLLSNDGDVSSRALVVHSPVAAAVGTPIDDATPEEEHKMVPRKSFKSRVPLSDEDAYRRERVCLFYSAGRDLADSFKAYRRFLLWIFSEFQLFADYCHKNVFSKEMREQFVKDTEERILRERQGETVRMQASIERLEAALASTTAKLKALETSTQGIKAAAQDYEATLRAKDAEIQEAAEGRAALLGRISRLEKELWRQRDALEGPEAQISGLEKQIKLLEDKLVVATKATSDVEAEKAVLKVRVERLEEVVKEKKSSVHEMVPKFEIVQLRRQYVEALELVAALQAQNGKLANTVSALEKDLELRRGDAPATPRPPWQLCDEFFPRAASTAQRVHLAIKEYRFMLARNECLVRQFNDLRSLVSMQDRDDAASASEGAEPELDKEVLAAQMAWKHFPKLGFDSSVPPFLKGTGRAENLKFNRSQVKQLCRVFFNEVGLAVFGEGTSSHRSRDATGPAGRKSTTVVNVENILSKMATKFAPSGASAHDFLYSFWYGMQWFAYDCFISAVRKTIADLMDEAVLIGMHREAHRVRESLSDRGEKEAEKHRQQNPTLPEDPNTLSKTIVVEVLADTLAYKAEEDVKRLIAAVNRDCPGPEVSISTLLKYSSKERSFSHFLDELYTQHLVTRRAMERVCIEAVFDASIETDGRLAPTAFAQSLWKMNPMIPVVYMDSLVADIFEITLDELRPAVDDKGPRRVGISGNRLYLHNDLTLSDELSVIRRLQRRVHVPYSPMYEKE